MTARHHVRTPTVAVVLAWCLLSGCESGRGDTAQPSPSTRPSSAAASGSAVPPLTAVPPPATGTSPPTVAAVTRLVIDSPDDPSSVTVDVPPDPDGYVVAAGCVGRPDTSVSWAVTRTVGPVGDPATGGAACDGAEHVGTALQGSPVAVQVRLRLDLDPSGVSSAWAVLRPAG